MADLNALIAQGAQFQAPVDPFAQYSKMQQLEQGQRANALAQMQIDKYRQDIQQLNAVRSSAAPDGVNAQLWAIDPKMAMEQAKEQALTRKQIADTKESEEKTRASQMKALGTGLVTALKDPSDTGLNTAFSMLDTQGIDTSKLRAQFSQVVDPKQRLDMIQGYVSAHPEGIAAMKFVAPDPVEVKLADGRIKFIDKNPNSPTFKQEVKDMGQATGMTPFQTADIENRKAQLGVAQAGLGLHALTADPFNLAGAQDKFPLGMGGGGAPAAAPASAVAGAAPVAAPKTAPVAAAAVPTLGGGKVSLNDAIKQGLKGTELLAAMPAPLAAQVAAITDHRAAPPARNTARGDQLIQLVQMVDPTYDAQQYKTKQGIETAFTVGLPSRTLKSINVANDHLKVLNSTIDALNNGDVRLFNQFGNAVATQIGVPAPTDFNAVKVIVADELAKAVIGGVGALGDRKTIADTINAANGPAALRSVINRYQQLMDGQRTGLSDQYKSGGGNNAEVLKLLGQTKPSVATKPTTGGIDTSNPLLK